MTPDPVSGRTGTGCTVGSGEENLTLDAGVFCGLTIDCPEDLTIECGDVNDPSDLEPVCHRLCTGGRLLHHRICRPQRHAWTPGCGGSFTITRVWSAVDACEQVATCTQTLTVVDTSRSEFGRGAWTIVTVECMDDVPEAPVVTSVGCLRR